MFKILLSTCTLLCCMNASIAQNKKLASNENSKTKPKFIQGVVIENNNSTTGGIAPKKNNTNTTIEAPSELADKNETAVNKSEAQKEIIKGLENNMPLYAFIDDWYGVPYRYGGTTRKGIDCSAFTRQLYNDVYNKELLRTSSEQFNASNFIGNQSQLKEGDLVFFKIRSKNISHVGVYLSDGKFVHASRSKGIVISSLDDAYWSRYYVGGGRVNSK